MTETIKQAEASLETVRQNGEILARKLSDLMPAYIAEGYDDCMARAITGETDLTLTLHKQGRFGQLKREFQEKLNNIPDESKKKFEAFNWPHRANILGNRDTMDYFKLANETRKALEEIARIQLGGVRGLLVEFGYSGDNSNWNKQGGNWRYASGLSAKTAIGREFNGVMEKYEGFLCDDFCKAAMNLAAAIRTKKSSEAKSLRDGV
jgi:hypothetical protein